MAASLLPASASLAPAWQTDYRQALELGGREHKPLVVVIGSGKTPWANLARAAEQDGTINETLRNKYVCLFVDTDTTEGQRVARSFEISGPGIVISNRSGEYQAYRHAGELPATELASTLTQHTDDVYVSRKLAPPPVQAPVQPVSYYYPAPMQYQSMFGSCPNCRR